MRYHGGKFRIAHWIISFFPAHLTYVEPFAGAASVLFQKTPSYSEIINDMDSRVVNIFKVLRDPALAKRLHEQMALTPYSRVEFEAAINPSDDMVEQARRSLIRSQMGFGSAGMTKDTTGFRIDSGRNYQTTAHLWARHPDLITGFCERLKKVMIENRPASRVIADHDRADTLYYADPPYMHDTRVMRDRGYQHEMDPEAHEALLTQLLGVKGMVVLSGYDHDMYNDALVGWAKHQLKTRIGGGRGAGQRTEILWINPACAAGSNQAQLFDHVIK